MSSLLCCVADCRGDGGSEELCDRTCNKHYNVLEKMGFGLLLFQSVPFRVRLFLPAPFHGRVHGEENVAFSGNANVASF